MANVFSGTLALFKATDVLKMLTSGRKTGLLRLERGREQGEVFVLDGDIVHARYRNEVGDEAVFGLMTWVEGLFRFTTDVKPEDRTVERDTVSLLDEGMRRIEEWDQIREIVPSQDMVFKLSANRAPEEVTIRHDDWAVLSEIDGYKTVGEISDVLQMKDYETARIIYKLFVGGLIEVGVEPKLKSTKTVDNRFLNFVEERLTEIIGPVAAVVLEEEIAGMGEERNQFPLSKTSLLIEKVSAEIDDDVRRAEFQRMVLGALRGI
jgi:hypothetical protein